MRAKVRVSALGVLLLVVGAVSGYLYHVNRLADLDESFDERLTAMLEAGQVLEAAKLVEDLNRARPGRAVVRTQKLNNHLHNLHTAETGLVPKMLSQAGWPKMVKAAARAKPKERRPEPLDCGKQDGVAEVLYVRDPGSARNADLLPELLAILGKNSLAPATATDVPRPGQRIVIAPGSTPAPALGAKNPVLYLSPSPQAQELLGLTDQVGIKKAGCRLHGMGPEFLSTKDIPTGIPIPGDISTYHENSGLEVLATARCESQEYPALLRLKRKEGPIDMFTFDVLRAIVLLRQGDPALAGQEHDGIAGLRASDLFPYHLSFREELVPFTDLLMHGLVRLLEGDQPSIRLWHHPAGRSTSIVLTSDQDGIDQTRMSVMVASLRNAGVSMTIFLTAGTHAFEESSTISQQWVEIARRLGVDFGAHTLPISLPTNRLDIPHIGAHHRLLEQQYGSMRSIRFHMVKWYGWMDPVRDLERAGYGYDLSYMTTLSDSFPGMGYMTGSGLPIRFYDEEGRPTRVIQLATQIDDQGNPMVLSGPLDRNGKQRKLSREDYMAQPLLLLSASAELFHSPLVLNNHPFQFLYDPEWLLSIIEHAKEVHAALLNVAEYDDFLAGLKGSSYVMIGNDRLSYRLCVQNDQQDILLVGREQGGIEIDGKPVTMRHEKRFGREMAVLTVNRGDHLLRRR